MPAGPGDDVPSLDPGDVFVSRDGVADDFEISRQDNMVTVKSNVVIATLAIKDPTGTVLPLSGDGYLRVDDLTSLVSVDVSGFRPSSTLETWMYSKGKMIGKSSVGVTGETAANYPIPADTADGRHRIMMTGVDADGKTMTIAIGIMVGSGATGNSASRILLILTLGLAAFTGIFLPAALRRRRREDEQLLQSL